MALSATVEFIEKMKNPLLLLLLILTFPLFSQQNQVVDFIRADAAVELFPSEKMLKGKVQYEFKIFQQTDSIYLDAKNMVFSPSGKSTNKIKLSSTDEKLWLIYPFETGKTYKVEFLYSAKPSRTMYFVGWEDSGSNQIWTQGQGKKTSYWLPSIDDLNKKIEFDLSISAPKEYEVIANGILKNKTKLSDSVTTWNFDMEHPMSSYLVALAVGKYSSKNIFSESGVPIKLFYEPKDSLKVEPTYRHSKEIFDFLENEIGVAFPWQDYKQVPVRDFLYAGMENTTLTIFAEAFVIDSTAFIDRNFVNVNAHELAHQWFGDYVTQASDADHWLQEGFATYYALLAERQIFGDDYYYFKLYQTAEQLKSQSDEGKGESLLNPKASSLTFYQKGAWALHILREKIGNDAFRKAVKNYLEKNPYKNVTTADFILEAEKSSGMDLFGFEKNWLQQTAFQADEALASLRKSTFMVSFLNLAAMRESDFQDKKQNLSEALNFPVNDYLGQEAVQQLSKEAFSKEILPLYKKAFASENILVRQAIITFTENIPKELQPEYESLLKDDSYFTKEKALLLLWLNFQEKQSTYLDATEGIEGFPDKNVELLRLTLNLVTPNYHPEKKKAVFKKLSAYTSPEFAYPIRENAFGYLYQINTFTAQNYKDLLQGCVHPVWRFQKFCRELLDELLEDADHRENLKNILEGFPQNQQQILNEKLN